MTIADIVDRYGLLGFGAIAITDHVAEEESLIGQASIFLQRVLTRESFVEYRSELAFQAARAWDQYGMVVLPGFELSKNSVSDRRSAHILALGVSTYMTADADASDLCRSIRECGGVSVAAHPVFTRHFEKQTYHLWDRRRELGNLMDAWEVGCGPFFFEEVRRTKLPKLANSDLHIPRHMTSWKTVLSCERHPEAVLRAIRQQEVEFVFYKPPIGNERRLERAREEQCRNDWSIGLANSSFR